MQEQQIIDDLNNGRRDKVLDHIARGYLDMNQPLSTGRYPLYYAVSNSPNEELLRALLSKFDININVQDKDGMTPLMWAADFENYTALSLLIEKGADPELVDNQGRKAIDMISISNSQLLNDAQELFETRESKLVSLDRENEITDKTTNNGLNKSSLLSLFWGKIASRREESTNEQFSLKTDDYQQLLKKRQ